MKNMRILLTIILLAVGSWSIALGQGSAVYFSEPSYSTDSNDLLATWSPPEPGILTDVTDSLLNNTVGQQSDHQIGFRLPPDCDDCGGWLKGRFVIITFPPGFELAGLDSVSYHDTSLDEKDPDISSVCVFSQSVAIRFRKKIGGPSGSHFAYLTLHGVKNDTIAENYEVIVSINNSNGRIVAGPNSSSPFSLIPDEPVTIGIRPFEDLELIAGETIIFSAGMVDQYGNRISDLVADWGIDPDHDPIGSMVGPVFTATTAGIGRVMAEVGELSAYSGFITVSTQELALLEISWPEQIRAGQSFEFQITNARDEFGKLFYGRVLFWGGEIAPDGTEPFLSTADLSHGQGHSAAVLYSSGNNDIRLSSGGYDSAISVSILPGELASIALEISETQFLRHNFVGDPTVTVLDPYGNIKVNFSESGSDLSISVDDGSVMPDLIPADAFVDGLASLSGYKQALGNAGERQITVSTINQQDDISSSSVIFANGPTLVLDEEAPPPETLYQHWEYLFYTQVINLGNLAPTALTYNYNLIGDEELYLLDVTGKDCLPQPHDLRGCISRVHDSAYMSPGSYHFAFDATATYDYNGEEIQVENSLNQNLEILPFEEFRVELVSAQEVGYAADYNVPLEYALLNENDIDQAVRLVLTFYVTDGEFLYLHNRTSILNYDWPDAFSEVIDFHFSDNIPEGLHLYGVSIDGRIYVDGSNVRTRLIFRQQIELGKTLNIIPRATFTIDPGSVMPKIVNAGASIPLSFALDVETQAMVLVRGHKSKLTLTNGAMNSSAYLVEENYLLNGGTAQLTTQPLFIPSAWQGQPITAILSLVGTEGGFLTLAEDIIFNPVLTVTSPAHLEIINLQVIAPNAPFVNTDQKFEISGEIVNRSLENSVDTFVVSLISDGASQQPPAVVIPKILPGDTANVNFTVIASATSNPAELFHLQVDASGVVANGGAHNNVVVITQTPPLLFITAEVVDHPGEIALFDYDEQFEISAFASNSGQGGFSGGTIQLRYDGPGDFHLAPIEDDSVARWSLTSPAENTESFFTIFWLEFPLDLNSGEPVAMSGEPVDLPFVIRASTTQLILHADGFNNRLLQRGVESKLFDLLLENITNDSRNTVGLFSMAMILTDRNGIMIPADRLTVADGSNFYLNGSAVSTMSIVEGQLHYQFSPLVIQPGELVILELRLKPLNDASLDFFSMRLAGDNISAEHISGPRVGEDVPVNGLLDQGFDVSIPQAIISEEFASSFRNYPNPFNPRMEASELRYFLSEDSDVDIYIFTQTGEKVRQFSFASGSNGGRSGINSGIYWDGLNGNGDEVLNGVYIALIKVANGNLTAKLKIAVVK